MSAKAGARGKRNHVHVIMVTVLGVLVWGTSSGCFDHFFTPAMPSATRVSAVSSFGTLSDDDVNEMLDQILAREARQSGTVLQ